MGAGIPQPPAAPAAHQQCLAYEGGLLAPATRSRAALELELGSAGAVWGWPCHTPLAGPSWLVYEASDGKQQPRESQHIRQGHRARSSVLPALWLSLPPLLPPRVRTYGITSWRAERCALLDLVYFKYLVSIK